MKKTIYLMILSVILLALFPLFAHASGTVETREQLVAYITAQAAAQPTEIPFEYSSALNSNISDSSWMSGVLYDSGIFSASWSYGGGKCTLKKLQYMPEHTFCTTENEVLAALRSATSGSVNIRLPQALFDSLRANNFEKMHMIEGEAGFEKRKMTYYESCRLLMYSEIVFAENFVSVGSINDLRNLMLSYQAASTTSYTVHCSEVLYQLISVNDFHVLHGLEGDAGFKSRNMTYYSSKHLIEYSNIEYAPNYVSVQTLEELKQWMQERCLALEENFSFHCSDELYATLSRNDFDMLYAIENNCGIYVRDMRYNDSKQHLYFTNVEYYPGYYIARCLQMGRMANLSARSLSLYNEAKDILDEVQPLYSHDRLALQFALQDAIMSRIEYLKGTDGVNGDYDTAFGALLNGRCECDGYADAFYLVATMAGFDVRFQFGKDINDGELHLWNTIAHDGQWYFTDLTWCDSTDDSHHLYSNIGYDIAKQGYDWNEACSLVPLAASTSAKYYYYTRENVAFESMKEAGSYVTVRVRAGKPRTEILLTRTAGMDIESFIDEFGEYIGVGYRSNYKYTDSLVSIIFYPRE